MLDTVVIKLVCDSMNDYVDTVNADASPSNLDSYCFRMLVDLLSLMVPYFSPSLTRVNNGNHPCDVFHTIL